MPKFRCLAAEAQYVADVGVTVEPDELLDVPGELVEELDDAYVVRSPLGDRAWPKALWSDTTPASPVTALAAKDEE